MPPQPALQVITLIEFDPTARQLKTRLSLRRRLGFCTPDHSGSRLLPYGPGMHVRVS